MKAIHSAFTKIINGVTQFTIPVFQRDYRWTEDQCEQLWKDVIEIAATPGDRGHFLGSVVYISSGDSSAGLTRWLLIDGQQRVTTLTLLLAALRDHITDSAWKGSEDGPTAKRVEAYFLKNVEETGNRQYKVVLRRHDQDTLCALLDKAEPPKEISERIRDNYDFFREKLKAADPEDVYRGIGRLVVVDVTLDRGVDDPQLIFESLNSTGMDLSQSDLIRNFILMRLPEQEQTRLYESYWRKIESLFRGSERTFDAFARDYLALRTQASKQERADEIYSAFRRSFGSVGSNPQQLEAFLKEFLRFARYHAAFSVGADTAEPPICEALTRLRHQVDVPATLIMRLFDCYDELNTISPDEFIDAINLIYSYVFRRAICSAQTRGYWQVFANIAYGIDPHHPMESLKVGLARLSDTYNFIEDAEFSNALEEQEIFQKRGVCFELLERLENHGNKEPSPIKGLSIEHIMPQNEKLSREWRAMLGSNWREVHREWLHRLGNLTLTAYNSPYSDKPFEEKKSMTNGFSESAVRLNKFVREQSAWTATEMEKRGKALASRALGIWPPLVVDKALIDAANREDMIARAKKRDAAKVPMSTTARALFDYLHGQIASMDASIVELAEPKSVSFHGPAFFLEVLPRKNRIILLLGVEYSEIDDPTGMTEDASQRNFFVNNVYEAGAYISISEQVQIDLALPIVRQVWNLTRA